LEQADDREEWLHALDRPVPLLQAVTVPDGTTDIAAWARRTGQDAARLQRLNPAFVGGRITRGDGKPARLLAVATGGQAQPAATPIAAGAVDAPGADSEAISLPSTSEAMNNATASATSSTSSQPVAEPTSRHHTVVRGDSPWKIAARYGIRVADLLQRNGLDAKSVLKPGRVLVIDAELVAGSVGQAAGTP
jgi:membrane-bound lytic murein transglycosylase D